MSAKGIDAADTENIIGDLNIVLQNAVYAYNDDHDPNKCSKLKQAISNYFEIYEAMRDCIIEAGPTMQNYQQLIDAAHTAIDLFNNMINSLGC